MSKKIIPIALLVVGLIGLVLVVLLYSARTQPYPAKLPLIDPTGTVSSLSPTVESPQKQSDQDDNVMQNPTPQDEPQSVDTQQEVILSKRYVIDQEQRKKIYAYDQESLTGQAGKLIYEVPIGDDSVMVALVGTYTSNIDILYVSEMSETKAVSSIYRIKINKYDLALVSRERIAYEDKTGVDSQDLSFTIDRLYVYPSDVRYLIYSRAHSINIGAGFPIRVVLLDLDLTSNKVKRQVIYEGASDKSMQPSIQQPDPYMIGLVRWDSSTDMIFRSYPNSQLWRFSLQDKQWYRM